MIFCQSLSRRKREARRRCSDQPKCSKLILMRPLTLATILTLFALGCGGGSGGGSDPGPSGPPGPPTGNFGASLASGVPRDGVAGCWGYTAPDGGRYGLMGTAKGVLVVDLRNPDLPRVVDEVDGPTNTSVPGIYWREMRVYGHYAYICSEHTNFRGGVMVLDLAGLPDQVRYVRSIPPHDGQLYAHTVDIDPATGLLYLQRYTQMAAPSDHPLPHHDEQFGTPGQGSVEIWDLKADPEQPTYVTTFNQGHFVHDMTARNGRCYVAEGYDSAYSVWNITDPRHPALVVRWNVASGHFAHNIWPSEDGSFVATTEEVPRGLPMRIWSLNGGLAPTARGSFKYGDATPHNVHIEGTRAYLSHYSQGLVVVDISNLDQPTALAHWDTSPFVGSDYEGCWGVFKFPGQPLMLGSDIQQGLQVVRITAP